MISLHKKMQLTTLYRFFTFIRNVFLIQLTTSTLLVVVIGDDATAAAYANCQIQTEQVNEHLALRTLSDGKIGAHFIFQNFVPTDLDFPFGNAPEKHSNIFPLSMVRMFHRNDVQELHLSLTKGKWKHDLWGLPFRDVPPNAYLWVWFRHYLRAEENWLKLTSLLSGQFCASLNQITPIITVRPKFTLFPFMLPQTASSVYSQKYGFLAALSQEAICTENLTPWIKLLPCRSEKGLSKLLNAVNLFNSKFFSMSIDFKFSCLNILHCEETTGIELTQSITVVFDAPLVLDGRYSWTLNSLFNSPLQNYCPLASSSHVWIDVSHLPLINGSKLNVPPSSYVHFEHDNESNLQVIGHTQMKPNATVQAIYADYDLRQMFDKLWLKNDSISKRKIINLGVQYPPNHQKIRSVNFTSLKVDRHLRGFGLASGGVSASITNELPNEIYAAYLENIPWQFRVYLHTLVITVRALNEPHTAARQIKPNHLQFEPARDRLKPCHLELLLHIPAKSRIEIEYKFEHQFLRWTEYPPDANHGLYINPATVTFYTANYVDNLHLDRFLPHFIANFHANSITNSTIENFDEQIKQLKRFIPLRLFTNPILIPMPTPDFSMPYNVVCLVSTVVCIGFGPLYNLTTRRTKPIRSKSDDKKKKKKNNNKKKNTKSSNNVYVNSNNSSKKTNKKCMIQ